MTTEIVHLAGAELARVDFSDAFAAFLRLGVAQGDASPATVRAYESTVRSFCEWCEQHDLQAGQVTEDDVRAWRRDLIDAGYSRPTVASYLRRVKRFYDAAVWRGLRADNPVAGLRAPKDTTARADRVKYLPLAGLRRLLDAPDLEAAKGRRDRAILGLMGIHGLRVAEVAGLQVQDLHLGEPAWVTVQGKGGKTRQVYLVAKTLKALETWLSVRPTGTGAGHVFVTLDNRTAGQSIGTRNLRRMVDGYLDACGLKGAGISCHSLRHSAATWSLFAGATERSVQDMLGHAKPETTQIYAAVVDRISQNPAGKLAELLGL